MSQTNGVLPDPQTAYAKLFDDVHARVFFQKCAASGISPRSIEEANWMLETTAKLREVTNNDQVKQAGAEDNPFYQMNAHLDRVLASHGIGQPTYQDQQIGIEKAAASLMQDPEIYNSVLSLKVAEAMAMNAEFEAQQAARR